MYAAPRLFGRKLQRISLGFASTIYDGKEISICRRTVVTKTTRTSTPEANSQETHVSQPRPQQLVWTKYNTRTIQQLKTPFPIDDLPYLQNAVTSAEAEILVNSFAKKLKRKRYEGDHWDGVIINYREFEMGNKEWKPEANEIIERLKQNIRDFVGAPFEFLPRTHILDLHENGWINGHLDSVKFSGGIVCGLSLLSDAVVRFTPCDPQTGLELDGCQPTDVLLHRNSLYVMKGPVRYNYTHAILPVNETPSHWREDGVDTAIMRQRRISVLFRDELGSLTPTA
eukprot:m.21126 g.21126  ORF g.21126 m.21126 type:complete len:284 (+) comp13268_c0_seq1:86-937(+)